MKRTRTNNEIWNEIIIAMLDKSDDICGNDTNEMLCTLIELITDITNKDLTEE